MGELCTAKVFPVPVILGGLQLIRIEIKKILKNPAFYAAVMLMCIAFYFGIYQERSSDILYLFENTTSLGIVHVLLPALVVLPYAASCAEEINSDFYRYAVIRSNAKKYICSRVIASILSAFLVCLVAEMLFVAGILLFRDGYVGKGARTVEGTFYQEFYEDGRYIVPLVCKMYAFSIAGIIWALFALMLSCFTGNRYVVIAGPFLANILFSFLAQSLDEPISLLDPGLVFIKGPIHGLAYGGLIYVTLYQVCGVILLSGIIWMAFNRRIKNG